MKKLYALTVASVIGICALAPTSAYATPAQNGWDNYGVEVLSSTRKKCLYRKWIRVGFNTVLVFGSKVVNRGPSCNNYSP